MICISKLDFSFGLLYYDGALVSGAQTIRPGRAGPVSILLGGEELTGCFFSTFFTFTAA